jgi:hypothetical protein
MTQAVSISLSKFTNSVQAAVKAAVAKHPKFKVEPPHAVTVAFLIRGFPVPESVASAVTLGETQAFAADIAAQIAGAHPEILRTTSPGQAPEGAVISLGRHVIVGIPPASQLLEIEK